MINYQLYILFYIILLKNAKHSHNAAAVILGPTWDNANPSLFSILSP